MSIGPNGMTKRDTMNLPILDTDGLGGKRLGFEMRWQQIPTPGIRTTTLSTCISAAR